MPSCAVANCSNYSKVTRGGTVKYFRFPKDEKLRKRWITACYRQEKINVNNASICSSHFSPEHLTEPSLMERLLNYTSKTKRGLEIDAVPTLNLPEPLQSITDTADPLCTNSETMETQLHKVNFKESSPNTSKTPEFCSVGETHNEIDILSFSTLCRICLKKELKLVNIFDCHADNVLSQLTDLEIIHGDRLPENICSNCYNRMVDAFSFKELCESNNQVLHVILEESLQKQEHIKEEYNDTTDDLSDNCDNALEVDIKPSNIIHESENINLNKLEPDIKQLENVHKCPQCDKVFKDSKSLKRHSDNHNVDKKTHICAVCKKPFLQKYELKIHFRQHTGEKPLVCKICKKPFSDPRGLKRHMLTHTGEKNYKCEVCNKAFAHRFAVGIHMRTHTSEKPFICSYCGKSFVYAYNLTVHTRNHTGETPYSCQICDRQFKSKSILNAHMLIHSKIKRFVCNICGKETSRSGDLTIHMRTHTGEKPYECTLCPKKFKMSSHLAAHVKSHAGKKDFICSICKKAYYNKRMLTMHMSTHNGIKLFECTVCNKKFTHSSSLSAHHKTHKE